MNLLNTKASRADACITVVPHHAPCHVYEMMSALPWATSKTTWKRERGRERKQWWMVWQGRRGRGLGWHFCRDGKLWILKSLAALKGPEHEAVLCIWNLDTQEYFLLIHILRCKLGGQEAWVYTMPSYLCHFFHKNSCLSLSRLKPSSAFAGSRF